MLELEENLRLLNSLISKINNLYEAFGISSLKEEETTLKEKTESQGFWEDTENSNKIFVRLKRVQRKIESFEKIKGTFDDLIRNE